MGHCVSWLTRLSVVPSVGLSVTLYFSFWKVAYSAYGDQPSYFIVALQCVHHFAFQSDVRLIHMYSRFPVCRQKKIDLQVQACCFDRYHTSDRKTKKSYESKGTNWQRLINGAEIEGSKNYQDMNDVNAVGKDFIQDYSPIQFPSNFKKSFTKCCFSWKRTRNI